MGLPAGTTITVTQGTAVVPVSQKPGISVSFNGNQRKSVLQFEGTKDAEYVVTVAGQAGTRRFLLTHHQLLSPLLWSMAWGAAAFTLAALGFLFLILALTGVFPKRPKAPVA